MINYPTPVLTPTNTVPALAIRNLRFDYALASAPPLFDTFSLNVKKGEVVAIMGPSGSGKSTLARIAAGILNPNSGLVERPGLEIGDTLYLDQDPLNSVFPWQRVLSNVIYPQKRRGSALTRATQRAHELLNELGLAPLSRSYPASLSGGELQRVALARGLAWSPKLLVLDEVFSALDVQTKMKALAIVRQEVASAGTTVLFITHAVHDALALGTRCIVLGGRPVKLVADVQVPRFADEYDPAFVQAREVLIDAVRHGYL